jgi:hypothetical protein
MLIEMENSKVKKSIMLPFKKQQNIIMNYLISILIYIIKLFSLMMR